MIKYADILIINDMPDQIALLSSILEDEGFRIFAASSGKAARYFLEKRLPDLILLDIQMGDISGLEICRIVRSMERSMYTPIIFLTSEADVETVSLCFELGANDHIRKPFAKEELLARIKTQLRIAVQRKELIAANDELTQFCTAVTHDLKAPFTVIRQLLNVMQMKIAAGEDTAEVMGLINMKASQTQLMIERLFEFSRMCNVVADVTSFSTKEIVEEIYHDLKNTCPERDITFECGRLPRITADETLFRNGAESR